MELFLEIKKLNKAFSGIRAVLDFDLSVNKGDLIGIIGPNGAGKTTLFNMITSFIRADSGEILFKGENITYLKPFQIVNRGISRTFQLVDLFKEMTVLETIMIPCFSKRVRNYKHREEKPRIIAMKVLEEMGMSHRYHELIKNLAFGELRLVDVARAMITEPDILLLDEPFSGLDIEGAGVLSKVIQQMHQKGETMVIIEHRLRDLMKLVGRVVVINFGQKIAEGAPDEIIKNEKVITAYLGKGKE